MRNVRVVPFTILSFLAGETPAGAPPDALSFYADAGTVRLPNCGTLAWPKHTFLGWSDGNTVFPAGSAYPCDADVTELTATWARNELAAPVIDVPEVFYDDTATVTISAESGAEVRYTLDGSAPNAGSTLYTSPFVIGATTTIRAVAMRDDYFDSQESSLTAVRDFMTFGEAVNAQGLTFTPSDGTGWRRVSNESPDGCALRSGEIGHNATSRLETVVSGEGFITFSCRVEGEVFKGAVYDGLAFCIDGVQQGELMGNENWTTNTFEVVGTGTHTLSWLYVKDEEGDGEGEDCAWVDAVTWTPAGVTSPIPAVAVDAMSEMVTNAIDSAGFVDSSVKEVIGGSATEYNLFKTWADGVKGATGDALAGEAAVVANEHAAAAYLLGAERLFENAPTVKIGELAISDVVSAGTKAMTVAVTVKDGERETSVDAEKVAAMFEATSDLGDWNGAAKLTPTVTITGTDASGKMTFVVTPGDGTAARAFLRIRR